MTRSLCKALWVGAAVVALGVAGPSGCGEEPESETLEAANGLATGTALFVVGNPALVAGDQVVAQRLQAAGLTVVVKKDSTAVAADATGKRLVVISSTVTSGLVGAKFTTVAVPVLAWESAVLDDLLMTGARSGIDFGTVASQRRVVIAVAAADPMAAGLVGTQTVVSAPSTLSWGKPGSAAVVVARSEGDATRSVIFRYEKGSAMVGRNAPERRVGFMLEDATASLLTTAGGALTDGAIRWAAHLTDAVCVPGVRRCTGTNAVQICDASGNWSAPTMCSFVCAAGACSGMCVPGATRCTGANTVQTCDASGNWATSATCPFACAGGACTGECAPGATRCSGTTVETCNSAGAWVTSGACAFVCSAGVCTGSCVPGARQCAGNVPQICDSAGNWQSSAPCPFTCTAAGICSGG